MKEIIINYCNQKKDILVLEDGKIVEQYRELDEERALEGNIYLGKVVDVLPGMQAAFVDIGEERNAFLHIKDILPKASNITGNKNEKLSKADIKKYIKVGDAVAVQIKKDKVDTKGARITTDLNIPGKYVALIPNSNFITVSSKIDSEDEIVRLKSIAEKNLKSGYGIIMRTASQGKNEEELVSDIKSVQDIYEKIVNIKNSYIENGNYPQKIFEAGGTLNKILLGLVDSCDKIIINNKDIYNFVKDEYIEYSEKIELVNEQNLIDGEILKQLEKLNCRKVWLKCGGFITIDKTEALTAIDVNTGKYIGKDNLEETVLKVNEEATIEIAKQLRARDIGGIVIIDYIDMEDKRNEEIIVNLMEKELKKDRSKTQVVGFTPLHLLEMTRRHLCSN